MLQGVSRFCKCAHETPQGVSWNPRLGKCAHETPQGVSGTQHTPEGVNLGSGCKTYAQTPGWYLQVEASAIGVFALLRLAEVLESRPHQ